MSMRLPIVLFAASAALAGLILLEIAEQGPAATPLQTVPPIPTPGEAQPNQRANEPRIEDLLSTALANPLFNPTRRPPVQAPSAAADEPDLTDVRLAGIVIEAGRRLAIFAPAGSKPLVRAEGEIVNQWRLDSVSPQAVSLSGPTGSRTLAPKPDPGLVRPAINSAIGQPVAVPINPNVRALQPALPQQGRPPAAVPPRVPPAARLPGQVPGPVPLTATAAKP